MLAVTEIDPVPITAWFLLILAVAGVAGIILRGVKWLNDKQESRINELIRAATYPIQEYANGSKSLPDANKKLDDVLANQEVFGKDLELLKDTMHDHIERHRATEKKEQGHVD